MPIRLRLAVGKTEFVSSTGVREFALGRVVAAELLAVWRRKLHDLSRRGSGRMADDIEQIAAGHPSLLSSSHFPIREAAAVSGFDVESLLRAAASGRMSLFYRAVGVEGFTVDPDQLEREHGPGPAVWVVPPPDEMPVTALRQDWTGMLQVRSASVPSIAAELLDGRSPDVVLFLTPGNAHRVFAPIKPVLLTRNNVHVLTQEVESLRIQAAALVSAEHIAASASRKRSDLFPKAERFASEAVKAYMTVRSGECTPEQARRVQAALDVFVELEGDPRLIDIDADRLERFRDDSLPRIPANENKVRLQLGSTSVSESIKAIEHGSWPRLSVGEQVTDRCTK